MSSEKRTCPCKRLPLCLSSFTAAAYGDVHSLSSRLSVDINRTDAGGCTPLHLAAQHNHIAATQLLLDRGAAPDGPPESKATPLHRASYAGAVATMRLLLDHKCNLLARDTSFGDLQTPLHKAAAGGRYLAVQLLLDVLRAQQKHQEDSTVVPLLRQGLESRDSMGRTPLDIAIELSRNQKEEQKSVQRWDEIAGGSANWSKCVELLESAAAQLSQVGANDEPCSTGTKIAGPAVLAPLPQHLVASSCLDCEATGDGQCLTTSWERAFRSVLQSTVSDTLRGNDASARQSSVATLGNQDTTTIADATLTVEKPQVQPSERKPTDAKVSALGRQCSDCGTVAIALFPRGDHLVCRMCAGKKFRVVNR